LVSGGVKPELWSRRAVNWILGVSVTGLTGSILYPVIRFMSPPEVPESTANEVEAGPANDPALLDRGFKIVRFGAEPVILIRLAEGNYRAFAATCTHLDCIVEYQRDKNRIWCNCHNGEFDLTGRNVAGPPPRPLAEFQVNLVAGGPGQPDTIVVSRI
jgi:cytochrome b6-f complex iron-sulfur subunit